MLPEMAIWRTPDNPWASAPAVLNAQAYFDSPRASDSEQDVVFTVCPAWSQDRVECRETGTSRAQNGIGAASLYILYPRLVAELACRGTLMGGVSRLIPPVLPHRPPQRNLPNHLRKPSPLRQVTPTCPRAPRTRRRCSFIGMEVHGQSCALACSPLRAHFNELLGSHHLWLRDHCRCPECFHPITKQRLVNTFEVRR